MNYIINPFSTDYEMYAKLFDEAYDAKDVKQTEKLIAKCEKLLEESEPNYRFAPFYYSIATAYSDLQTLSPLYNNELTFEKSLFNFRKAIELLKAPELEQEDFSDFVKCFQLQLYTNYGVALNKCDRKLAAIKWYRNALRIDPKFSMACGDYGIDLSGYSFLLHDKVQKDYLNHFAYHYLKIASNDQSGNVDKKAIKSFKQRIDIFDEKYKDEFLEKELVIPEYSLGKVEEEQYRQWCLSNHLFLNPLNDLPLEHSCFAADTLQLPPIITSIEEPDIPIYFGMFNQLKQDYIYSRYLLFLFQTQNSLHFADKDTYLSNLYDYPQYSIRVENGKTAFKLLYALLDKVAFFANSYWNLGIKIRDVNFNSIWSEQSGGKKSGYQHKALDNKHNRALNSVRWIYKDFNNCFGGAQNPFAIELKNLRNALEHRYVKVHSSILYHSEKNYPYLDRDDTYHISEELLGSYIFELIRIIRELIIDLTMAVHIEEKKRKEGVDSTVKMSLLEYYDEWKV